MKIQILKDLFQVFFPDACPGCGRDLVSGENAVCMQCLITLEETNHHVFPRSNEVYNRFAGRVQLQGAASCFWFDKGSTLQRILSALKYHHRPRVGEVLGAYYGRLLKGSDFLDGVEGFVPVPLHPKREAERGYNQAGMIAEGLSSVTGIPVVQDFLTRRHATATQTRKGKEERWRNVEDLFVSVDSRHASLCLVDDVITTGATLVSCIRAMAHADSLREVRVLSVAAARKNG